jgi:hypothetical protein
VNTDVDCGSIGLLTLDALDVDDKFLTVHLHHLSHLLAFEVTSDHLFKVQQTNQKVRNSIVSNNLSVCFYGLPKLDDKMHKKCQV